MLIYVGLTVLLDNMAIDQLFFELLRVAIGTQDRLSRPPLGEEWRQLYDMAKKQSLVGILKGQGVGQLYAEHLRGLRQSGDIDVWVQNKSIPELVEYVKGLGVGYTATAAHVECEMFDGTDVELHAEPAFFRSFRNDRKLKRWFQEVSSGSKFQVVSGFMVPSIEFNLVYMMVHMYHHVLFEGLGLRQFMDYYFVLRSQTKRFQMVSSFRRFQVL